MKIVLDFDDTIFNTHQLMQESLKIFKRFDFSEEEFFKAYQECKKRVGDFDLDIVVSLVFKKFNNSNEEDLLADKKKIKEKIKVLFYRASDFVYPDFFDFSKNFKKKDLILLSFGTADFQGMKIKNSGVASYFQETIITQKDKIENLKNILNKNKGEKIFFIDDKTEQIDKVKEKLSQIITIKMERPQGGHINAKSKLTDYVVGNLDEARKIILD